VIGCVGSGKSALLSAILGEIALVQGRIAKHGRIAYISQQVNLLMGISDTVISII
jgi:ABC-type Mn2+/Zn2+ transport system ATPase subunit